MPSVKQEHWFHTAGALTQGTAPQMVHEYDATSKGLISPYKVAPQAPAPMQAKLKPNAWTQVKKKVPESAF